MAAKGKAKAPTKRKGRGSKAAPHKAIALDREVKALQYRQMGCTYATIAERLGLADESGAYQCVKRALAKLKAVCGEEAAEVRRLEMERLDMMLPRVLSRAINGDDSAIDRVLKIQARRAALMGLDAPTKGEISGPDGGPIPIQRREPATAKELEQIAARLKAADSNGAE